MATSTDDNFKKFQEKFEFILQEGVDCHNNSIERGVIWAKDTALRRVIKHSGPFSRNVKWAVHIITIESRILTCTEFDPRITDVNLISRLDDAFISTVSGACVFNKENTVKLLLEYGVDVNAGCDGCATFTPLHLALSAGEKEIFKLLLQKGANINARGDNILLQSAIWLAKEEYVKLLLENGADLNIRYPGSYRTPLYDAVVFNRHPKVVRFLLDAGADVNDARIYEETALSLVVGKIALKERLYSRELLKVVYQHVVSLRVVGLYVSEKNIQAMRNPPDELQRLDWFNTFESSINLYELECGQELERIKSTLKTNPSLKYILTTNNPRYLRNETLAQQLESINSNDFPIYGNLLKRKHENDKKKLSLLDGGMKALGMLLARDETIRQRVIPSELLEKIVCFLSNKDLQNLKFGAEQTNCKYLKRKIVSLAHNFLSDHWVDLVTKYLHELNISHTDCI